MIISGFSATKADGKVIRGLVYRVAEDDKAYPTVIFSHGFTANYRMFLHHGDGFASAGMNCIFYDFCGGAPTSLSDGSMRDMTVLSEAEDLTCVMQAAVALPYVDADRLFLQGESMGGFVSAYVAAHPPVPVKAMMLWYPAFVIPDDAAKRYAAGVADCMGVPISPDFDRIAKDIDIYRQIAGYNGPVKLIHGDADPIVPLSYSQRAVKTYENASLVVIPGALHGFDGKDSEFAREESIRFFSQFL